MPTRRRQSAEPEPGQPGPTPRPPRRAGRFRFCLRCLRRILLVPALLLVCLYVYLSQAGLPEFLKRRLVAELRARGVALEYGRMRLHLYRGVVAEGVTLGRPNDVQGPEITIPELTLVLDTSALWRLRFAPTAVQVRQGQFVLPLAETNAPAQSLVVDNVDAEVLFLPNDRWQLTHLTAECLGAQFHLRGELTNASHLRELSAPPVASAEPGSPWQQPLRAGIKSIRAMRFSRKPEIQVEVHADALDLARLEVAARFDAHDAVTEWGRLRRLNIDTRLNGPAEQRTLGRSRVHLDVEELDSQGITIGRIILEAGWSQSLTNPVPASADWNLKLMDIFTPWGETRQVEFTATGRQSPYNAELLQSELRLTSGSLLAGLVRSEANQFEAQLIHDGTSFLPRSADWRLDILHPQFQWGEARRLSQSGRMIRRDTADLPEPTEAWAWWRWLNPVELQAETQVESLSLSNVVADRVSLDARWSAPRLELTRLELAMGGREASLSAGVDVGVGQLEARVHGADVDVRRIYSLLGPGGRRWLDQYGWQPDRPPHVQGQAGFPLPPWTGIPEGWWEGFEERLTVDGAVQAADASFRGLPVRTVQLHVTHTNDVWRVRDLVAEAAEGRLELDYMERSRSKEYRFDVRSALDPRVLRPLVPEGARAALDFFEFTEPPRITGHVAGRWRSGAPPEFEAELRATNFVFRNEAIADFGTRVGLARGSVYASGVQVHAAGTATAEGVGFELASQRLFLTNAQSTVAPDTIARCISRKVQQTLSPYAFERPPQVRVDGFVNVADTSDVNLRVELAGGPFRYWRFNIPDIRGSVTWSNSAVAVHDVEAAFYDGRLALDLDVDLQPGEPSVLFRFASSVTNVDTHTLVADVLNPTNTLQGRLTGSWTVTRADSADMRSWDGYGAARVVDGHVMDVPLFSAVSDVVEGVIPGARLSKVNGLTATFTMTNSVLYTTDLKLPSPMMRLDYRGTIDFEGNVDARVESRLLRQAAVVGPVVSLLFSPLTKMLELRVTGTLGHPRTEPLYFPKPLLFPLNPIGTLKEMFSSDKEPPPAVP